MAANETTGRQVIVEDGISITITSEDGRLRLGSNGAGVSQQILAVDRSAVSTMAAVSAGAVSICFPAHLPDGEYPGVKKMLPLDTGWDNVFMPAVMKTNKVYIDKIPMFPVDLLTEAIDIAVQAEDGTILVASTQGDGSFIGDVDPTATSYYDPATGEVDVTFTKILIFDQLVTVRKRYPVTMAPSLDVALPGLVPYSAQKDCHFILRPDRPYLRGAPIAPGSLTMQGMDNNSHRFEIKDDGKGKLIGNVDVDGVNTIDYASGEVHVLLVNDIRGPLVARWAVYKEVTEYVETPSKNEEKARIRVDIDWDDIHRIVMSMKQASAAAQDNVKYRVDV